MGRIQANTGLVSGIDYSSIIKQLIEIESVPLTNLTARTDILKKKQSAATALSLQLTTASYMLKNLSTVALYTSRKLTSSNESVIKVTKNGNAPVGTYSLTSVRLAKSYQALTSGVANSTTALNKTGTISMGYSRNLETDVKLADINGGNGFERGYIGITDKSGSKATIDLRYAESINDVLDAINGSMDINVTAYVDGNTLKIQDRSGGTGTMAIREVKNGTTAASLGFSASTLTATEKINESKLEGFVKGNAILYVGRNTRLSTLNDGNGIPIDGILADLAFQLKDGTTGQIAFKDEQTIGDLLDTINKAAPGKLVAGIDSKGLALSFTDYTTSGTADSYIQGATMLRALGFETASGYVQLKNSTSASSVSKTGTAIVSPTLTNDDLLPFDASAEKFKFVLRDGTNFEVDLADAKTLSDYVDAINNADGNNGDLVVAITADGGISYTDKTTGTNGFSIEGTQSALKSMGLNATSGKIVIEAAQSASASHSGQSGLFTSGDSFITEIVTNHNAFDPATEFGTLKYALRDGTTSTISAKDTDATIDNLLATINGATSGKLVASINGSGEIVFEDTTTGANASSLEGKKMLDLLGMTSDTSGKLVLAAAQSMPNAVGAGTLILPIEPNDSLPINTNGNILTFNLRDGQNIAVDLTGASTYEELLDKINAASTNNLLAALSADRYGITFTDKTTGASAFSVEGDNASLVALGLNATNDKAVLKAEQPYAPASVSGTKDLTDGDTLLDTLSYAGSKNVESADLTAKTLDFTLRDGSSVSVTFDGTESTIDDLLNTINNASGANLEASVVDGAIVFTDKTNGTWAFELSGDKNLLSTLGVETNTNGTAVLAAASNPNSASASGTDVDSASTNDTGATQAFTFNLRNGETFNVDWEDGKTIGEFLDAINIVDSPKFTAEIIAGKITFSDHSRGSLASSISGDDTAFTSLGFDSEGNGEIVVQAALPSSYTGTDKSLAGGTNLNTLSYAADVDFDPANDLTDGLSLTLRDGTTETIAFDGTETSIDDILTKIKDAGGDKFSAEIKDGKFILTDKTTGANESTISGNQKLLSALGLSDNGPVTIAAATPMSEAAVSGVIIEKLENGSGLFSEAEAAGKTLAFTTRDGNLFVIENLGTLPKNAANAVQLQGFLDAINNAAGNNGKLVAAISADGYGLTFTDKTTGANGFSIGGDDAILEKLGLNLGFGEAVIEARNPGFFTAAESIGTDKFADAGNTTLKSLTEHYDLPADITDWEDLEFTLRDGTSGSFSFASSGLTSGSKINELIAKINEAEPDKFVASLSSDGTKIVLTDKTQGFDSPFSVSGTEFLSVLGATANEDGDFVIAVAATQASTASVSGTFIATKRPLSSLNTDGKPFNGTTDSSLKYTLRDGTSGTLTFENATTVSDLLNVLNNASAGKLVATLNSEGAIQLTDTTSGISGFSLEGADVISAIGFTPTSGKLVIEEPTTASFQTFTGRNLFAPMNSVLNSSLNGGRGLFADIQADSEGNCYVYAEDRAGNIGRLSVKKSALQGITSLQQTMDSLNESLKSLATPVLMHFELNANKDGLQLIDDSGGTGQMAFRDVYMAATYGEDINDPATKVFDSKIAESLGINTYGYVSSIKGESLGLQTISVNTKLADLYGGSGLDVTNGFLRVTDATGKTGTVALSTTTTVDGTTVVSSAQTVGDFIKAFNTAGTNVWCQINKNGDGLMFTDLTEEANRTAESFSIVDLGNKTVGKTMGIVGTFKDVDSTGYFTKSQSFSYTVDIVAEDTLTTIQDKINALGGNFTASIINDGSSAPFRLSINSKTTGAATNMNLNLDAIGMTTQTLTKGQDAIAVLGDPDSAGSLLVNSKTNTIKDIVPGMTVTLVGESSSTVQITSEASSDQIKTRLENFVKSYNIYREKYYEYTKYTTGTVNEDGTTTGTELTAGLLTYDSSIRKLDTEFTRMFQKMFKDLSLDDSLVNLAQFGVKIAKTIENEDGETITNDKGLLEWDVAAFDAAWEKDPQAVQKFFAWEQEQAVAKVDKNGKTVIENGKIVYEIKKVESGFATRFGKMVDQLIGEDYSAVTVFMNGLDQQIMDNEKRQEHLASRLLARQTYLTKQFIAMERSLAALQSQSSSIDSIATSAA